MKRLFTIAVIAMAASLTFAQAPLAKKKAAAAHRLERIADMDALVKKAKETKELRAAMAEKAAVANETSTSMLRKSSVKRGYFNSVEGRVLKTWSLGSFRKMNVASNEPYKSTAQKTTTQEGNVTVTTDANGIITDVAGVEPKMYERAATGVAFYPQGNQVYVADQSGYVTIIEDGNNVYIKNPITRYTTGAWVKGVKDGNTIKVATGQKLTYNTSYGASISLRWVVFKTNNEIAAADDYADAFTFTVNGNVLTLEGTSADESVDDYVMGSVWDDDNSFSGYADAETVLTYDPTYVAPSTELVTLPAGAEYTGWYMNCTSVSSKGETPIKNQSVNVAFVGNDVYVQGISTAFPTAWVKGTIDGTTITFDKFQYVGAYNGSMDCWFIGVNVDDTTAEIADAKATYNAETKTITFTNDVLVNAATDRIYYLNWFAEAVISAEEIVFEEPVITDLTAALPYSNTFETEEEQAQAAIYDANDDQSTFSFEKHSGTGSMVARYRYSTKNNADDYLVFPGVALEAGKKYKVSVDAASNSTSLVERLEVVAGKVAKASELTIPVIAATEVATKEFINLSNTEFTVAEDGTYFFAVHAISDADKFYLFVDNFSIAEVDASVPATVSDLAVVADAQGANKATVSFTVPATTVAGAALTEDVTVVVKRDGEVIKSDTKAAGAAVSFEDAVEEAGFYTYSVVASCAGKTGETASLKAYIGYDTPDAVSNITVADKSGSVDIAWEAPTAGANGYVVNPADFKYNVYPVEFMEFLGMTFPVTDFENPYATGLTETSANIAFDTNAGEMGFTYFAVTAENTTGESEDTYGAVVTGAPYQMPVFESVTDGKLSYWWGTACDEYNQYLEGGLYLGENSSDGDGVCFMMAAETAGWMTLESGKIALAGAVNPVFTFDYSGDPAQLDVTVITPNGVKDNVATFTTGTDFAPATISLAEFANEDWVRVIITGTFSAAGAAYIDNVRVYNMLDNNLVAKAITATSSIQAGDDVKVNVTVENQGSKAAEAGAYTVDIYCNDAKVESIPGTALESNATTTFEYTYATNVMTPSSLVWKAVVEYAADGDMSNNTTATVKTTIKTTNYPAVTDLAGTHNDGTVSLTWSEPEIGALIPATITEDFESYEGFKATAGDWTFVDVDDAEIGGFQGLDFSIDGVNAIQSKQSFWVHDVADETTWNQTYAAHSGTKYLAAMFRYDDGQTDDWAISPELTGNAQTVSFYAKSYSANYPEMIEVYYSTGSKSPADFIKVNDAVVVSGDWTEYTAQLPAGAKYFAIRSCATSSFMLMIDDVTYEAYEGFADLSLVGYNIYRDGVKLNAEPIAETSYTDATAATGEHSYVVTVVYDKGESVASNVVTLGVQSGISSVSVKAEDNAPAYNLAGQKVNDSFKGIVIKNGRKVVVK